MALAMDVEARPIRTLFLDNRRTLEPSCRPVVPTLGGRAPMAAGGMPSGSPVRSVGCLVTPLTPERAAGLLERP